MTTWYDQFENIQIDVTSYCNAKCVSCVRNINGSINIEGLKLEHLDTNTVKRMFNVDLADKYIEDISFNGVYGDACMHPDLIEIIDIIHTSHPETNIAISTNGSLRTTEWWKTLAISLSKFHKTFVLFAVDGLEDTHSIYRRNTDFNKVIENMKAFVAAGGNARMVTTIFDHNMHQITELQNLAESIGCHSFTKRRSFTESITVFDENGDRVPNAVPITAPNLGKKYKETIPFIKNIQRRKAYLLEQNRYVPESIKEQTLKKRSVYTEQPVYNKCIWHKQTRMIQIDPWGYVWPCCWIGKNGHDFEPHLKKHGHKWPDTSFLENNLDFRQNRGYDYNFHSLYNNSIVDILRGEWFNKTLPSSFTENPMFYCKDNCGVGKE
jgi:MoaA/NifB/PqqE/SkfB family radical SAM enzyme